jgi:hypothetical protein
MIKLEKEMLQKVRNGLSSLEINSNNKTVSAISLDLQCMIDSLLNIGEKENIREIEKNMQKLRESKEGTSLNSIR